MNESARDIQFSNIFENARTITSLMKLRFCRFLLNYYSQLKNNKTYGPQTMHNMQSVLNRIWVTKRRIFYTNFRLTSAISKTKFVKL